MSWIGLELLNRLVVEADRSLQGLDWTMLLRSPPVHRLAFRELGLAIGLAGLPRIRRLVDRNVALVSIIDGMQRYQPLAEQIEDFWSNPAHRSNSTWIDHRDINMVRLATSLAPECYLRL